jgi:ADP-ribosylglycohydrolase
MKSKAQAMLMAAFAADALAMPVHWIYDTGKLADEFCRVDRFLDPPSGSYHYGKAKGEFTHYGDQMLVLLESLAASNGFNLDDFAGRWRDLFAHYRGYVDRATKTTLENFARGVGPADAGSSSNDLAGASRVVPLVLCYQQDLDALIGAARLQTQMTHNNPDVIESAAFFTHVLYMVLHGLSPLEAVEEAAANLETRSPLRTWLLTARQLAGQDSVSAIAELGQTCHTPHAFRSVLQLLARHKDNLAEALVENIMAGGDSAARGILVAAVLAAHHGWDAIPEVWITELRSRDHLAKLAAPFGA